VSASISTPVCAAIFSGSVDLDAVAFWPQIDIDVRKIQRMASGINSPVRFAAWNTGESRGGQDIPLGQSGWQ